MDMPRLLRLIAMNGADSPLIVGGTIRRESSPCGFSTLITSAPISASKSPQNGPDITWVISSTRIPSSADFIFLACMPASPSNPFVDPPLGGPALFAPPLSPPKHGWTFFQKRAPPLLKVLGIKTGKRQSFLIRGQP